MSCAYSYSFTANNENWNEQCARYSLLIKLNKKRANKVVALIEWLLNFCFRYVQKINQCHKIISKSIQEKDKKKKKKCNMNYACSPYDSTKAVSIQTYARSNYVLKKKSGEKGEPNKKEEREIYDCNNNLIWQRMAKMSLFISIQSTKPTNNNNSFRCCSLCLILISFQPANK